MYEKIVLTLHILSNLAQLWIGSFHILTIGDFLGHSLLLWKSAFNIIQSLHVHGLQFV